ncbi:hypothetical protein A2363_00180 [Candidatus Gottesmanbacteria bacterium RIFOXYB1_FULL_47_11]|uniref:DUF5659 domain-containing protein n=1 Tax=Candidatus Gottesmanbacteria bacterium RIFOXYB1_FULL_47_11 TaxID=1798401 RepID=A0A1F6BD42_9BACT|nr:MAG: hypothetical protein A2363_00180 [Candidatus Gottesmanbacteria bacterium RIFOXYB1_FULL_47_11]
MDNDIEYETKDFFLSACILATGAKITKVIRQEDKTCVFVFNITPDSAKEIIRKHWNNELLLPTRSLIDAIHELKSRIYES